MPVPVLLRKNACTPAVPPVMLPVICPVPLPCTPNEAALLLVPVAREMLPEISRLPASDAIRVTSAGFALVTAASEST